MTLPATADTLDDLPEEARPFYIEAENGRWRLDADGLEDVSGLKSALEKERAERKALKAELAARGASPDDGRPTVNDEPEATSPPDTPRADAQPSTGSEDPPVAKAAGLEARLLEAEARAAIQAAQGVPELLLPIVAARLSVAEDGSVVASGEQGASLTVMQLVEGLRADPVYGRAFDGSGKGGSGAPVAARGDAGPVTVSASDPRAVARHIADIAAGRVRVA